MGLSYDAEAQHVFSVAHLPNHYLSCTQDVDLAPHQTKVIGAQAHGTVPAFSHVLATVVHPDHPTLFGGPALTSVDQQNLCTIAVTNSGPYEVNLQQGSPLGTLEFLSSDEDLIPLEGKSIDHLIQVITSKGRRHALTNQEIEQRAHLEDVPSCYKTLYLQVLQKHRHVISATKDDLGRSNRFQHHIHLKDAQPAYVLQFPLKPDHQQFIEATLETCL